MDNVGEKVRKRHRFILGAALTLLFVLLTVQGITYLNINAPLSDDRELYNNLAMASIILAIISVVILLAVFKDLSMGYLAAQIFAYFMLTDALLEISVYSIIGLSFFAVILHYAVPLRKSAEARKKKINRNSEDGPTMVSRHLTPVIIVIVFVVVAIFILYNMASDTKSSHVPICGDGICEPTENAGICDFDCLPASK